MTQLSTEHYGELFEKEVVGLAGAYAEGSPAPGVEAETTEVCEVHKHHEKKTLPL